MSSCTSCGQHLEEALYASAGGTGNFSLKSCPSCSAREGEHLYYPQDAFGFRTVGDGKYAQSWCASCRGQRVPLSAPRRCSEVRR